MANKRKLFSADLDWPKKSYKNLDFLNSPDGRLVRVLSEFLEPAARFEKNNVTNTIVFFGSARTLPRKEAKKNLRAQERLLAKHKNPPQSLKQKHLAAKQAVTMSQYYEDALSLAEKITKWSLGIADESKRFLVCTGGGPGIMEAANRGARKAGGKSIGLNINLPMEQSANRYMTKELAFEFHYFFIRKFWFVYLAKALIAFPGGFGTMDELFELLTLVQTRKSKKIMPIILYGSEYWNQLLNLKAMERAGTINKADLRLFRHFDDVDSTFEYIKKALSRHYLDLPPKGTGRS